jgi:hypothetical protein
MPKEAGKTVTLRGGGFFLPACANEEWTFSGPKTIASGIAGRVFLTYQAFSYNRYET